MTNFAIFSAAHAPLVVFDQAGLRIEFTCSKAEETPNQMSIKLSAKNSMPFPMENFLFQAAVTKVRIFCFCDLLGALHISIFLYFFSRSKSK